ncbi:MAG TPA: hypothetical protein VMC42_09170 [Methanoregulaceae archaeon]|nr:hypothetical protein [Methanoregulaceae archaeon]
MVTPERDPKENTTAEDVLLGLNKIFPIIKRLFGVKKIGIFGEFARRDPGGSDRIELLVEFSKGFESYRFYLDLRQYLADYLKVPVYLVTSRAYQEGERTKEENHTGPLPSGDPIEALIGNYEALVAKCGDVSIESFSRNAGLRDFAEDRLKTAALVIREISPGIKTKATGIPWKDIEAIGADIACSAYPADPHQVWHYLHSDLPVILANLKNLACSTQ